MTLQKLALKSGVNRENTRLTNEGGWYESDKVRFRQGTPEVIGGWVKRNDSTFLGVCRSLFAWVTLSALELIGVGTNLKFYIEQDDVLNDVTPIRLLSSTATLTNPFDTTITSATVTVHDTAHGALAGDLVTFTGAVAVGGIPALDFNKMHSIVSVINADSYTLTVLDVATGTVTGGGGTIIATYAYYADLLGNNPFSTTSGSATVAVASTSNGVVVYDFVTFSGATVVAGLTLNGEYQVVRWVDANTYEITAATTANATTTGGGAAVRAQYQINTGPDIQGSAYGWGAGYWGSSTWGNSVYAAGQEIRLWTQSNYGEDLIFGPRYGGIYYWDATSGIGARAKNIAEISGASYVPVVQQIIMVSDSSRFVLVFGANEIDQTALDPMLIRWSDQENYLEWLPQITNQAGSLRLSHGSEIYSAIQVRQEILVWTDTALYALQYLGAPLVWGATLIDDNLSCLRPNGTVIASGVCYWMGKDKFYKYDGRVQTLNCDVRKYVFNDISQVQHYQAFGTTNEAFNEVWWFYCSASSTTVDRYVVYNYVESIWYYGTMARTAWIDSGAVDYPTAATYNGSLVEHELGIDDAETGIAQPINAYITSAQFDIDDGHNFSFVWRVLPDLTFDGSTAGTSPQMTITLLPLQNSGSGYTVPPSVGGANSATVSRIGEYTVDQFTGQINTRIRARQMSIKLESNKVGTTWQAGSMRLDLRPDGRKS